VKKADLVAALAEQAGSTRRRPEPPPPISSAGQERTEAVGQHYRQPSRDGTAPITAHFPKEVRRQLKGWRTSWTGRCTTWSPRPLTTYSPSTERRKSAREGSEACRQGGKSTSLFDHSRQSGPALSAR